MVSQAVRGQEGTAFYRCGELGRCGLSIASGIQAVGPQFLQNQVLFFVGVWFNDIEIRGR